MLPQDWIDAYRLMLLIRRFEETVLENFSRGVFYGTTHTCIGQEADAAGVLSQIDRERDIVTSNHRSHGHFLAYGGDVRALFAELMGKASGVCGGWGGSQHLQWRNFYANGIQGGMLPAAAGMALAEKMKGSGAIAVAFLGDGTLGEGILYETLNLAALWKAPVLFVVEANGIAQTTPTQTALAGTMSARFAAFGIPVLELDTSDVMEISAAAGQVVPRLRATSSPCALILHTRRFAAHSKGDDTRPAEEVAEMRERHDPLLIHGGRLPEELRRGIAAEIDAQVAAAFAAALADADAVLAGGVV